jgi:hypothetical protein
MVMHRRRVGLVVIGSAVLLVAVLAGLRPHLVPGAAQALPVPGPPAVGDCVLDPILKLNLGAVAPVAADAGGTVPVYPAQQIQPCTGARYGEITAVIAAPKPTVVKGDNSDDRQVEDPNAARCLPTVTQYVGVMTPPIQRFWRPFLQILYALSRPSARQEAAGQRWAACIATLQPSDSAAFTRAQAAPLYGSSIRDAVHTGRHMDQLSNCIATADWNGFFTVDGCSQPHGLELMALGESGGFPVPRAQIEATCQEVARQLTAMPDPTAAGALWIQINVTDDKGTAITTEQVPTHSGLTCAVTTTGNRKLRGSLFALGRHPIPWA